MRREHLKNNNGYCGVHVSKQVQCDFIFSFTNPSLIKSSQKSGQTSHSMCFHDYCFQFVSVVIYIMTI